ncbi:MAG TPA: hypothetical protein VN362_16835 [Xanthobacteraceae bacterium]|nr:hypothetical protein [Xanthobacteraceae bacterium]
MFEFHAGAQWDVFEVRYVRVDDGVFVIPEPQIGTALEAIISVYKPFTPEWLNALSDDEKKLLAESDFTRRMHDDGAAHITWLFWRGEHRIIGAPPVVHGASAFLLDCGRGPFVVTAGHVYRQFLADAKRSRRLSSQIGNVEFDLGERLIDCGSERRIDIATFQIHPHEIGDLGKKIVVGTDGAWLAPPNPGEISLFGGFLGTQRIFIKPDEVSFGMHLGMTPVTDFTDHQIRCRLDRRYWVDVRGLGLPLPGFDLGGVSGGPLLVPIHANGRWSWRLAGVISEAQMHKEYEVVIAERAHFILPNGRIH